MESLKTIIPTVTLNNVIVDKHKTNNDNVHCSPNQADLIADKLILALNNPAARAYYCKLAYKLSEAQIWNNLEQAAKGKYPPKYFTWLCQRDLK